MAPIVAALAKAGLGLVAKLVMTKGKEVVEKKLGVNLEEMVASPQGLVQLKQIEAEREAELHDFLLAGRALDLQADQMHFTDTADARSMNARINESPNADWLPKNVPAILAIVVVAGGGAILAMTNEPDVRTAVVGLMTLVLGFYFGSSRGSKDKDEVMAAAFKGSAK